jgi:hypothetical protein
MGTQKTPAALLKEKQPVMKALARELRVSRWQAYGLTDPEGYPDAIPAEMFDVRSDLAERVASFIGKPIEWVREFYAQAKAVA